MKIIKLITVLFLAFSFLSSCKTADLRTSDIKKDRVTQADIDKGRQLLNKAVIAHGFDKLSEHKTYEAIVIDHFKGMMGKMGNPWGVNEEKISFKFSLGDFDTQMEILEGKKKGNLAGIQSWDYYERKNGNIDTNVKDDNDKIFGLAAVHYFFELAHRLSKTPYATFVDEEILNGKKVNKVFVSWGKDRNKNYDQYILWLDQEKGFVEAATFTLRDSKMMGSGMMKASMNFEDFREIDGILVPFIQRATMGNPKENPKKYLHEFRVQEFIWDNFDISQIRPLQMDTMFGDSKPPKN